MLLRWEVCQRMNKPSAKVLCCEALQTVKVRDKEQLAALTKPLGEKAEPNAFIHLAGVEFMGIVWIGKK